MTRQPWPRSACAQPLPTSPKPNTTATLPPSITSVARSRPSVQRVAAAVDVVELALGHRVVDVDRREQQRAGFHHLVEPVHAGRRLFADAADARRRRCVQRAGCPSRSTCACSSRMTPHSSGSLVRLERRHLAGLLELDALVHAAASRRRRRRRSASGRCRPATRAPRSCTTSTPRASRPSTRTPACPSGSAAVPPVSGRPTTTAAAA